MKHPQPLLHAGPADYAIIIAYALFVIGIGVVIGRRTKTSTDFFLSGRSIPAWVTGLAFLSANLGALEVLGMAANGYEYGIMTAHFYWIGAVPAMVFLGVAMMPFYYGSKIRSVPEYLVKRYNEPTRFINALTFAVSTLVLSGVSMYGMGLIFSDLLGWNIWASIWIAAGIVLVYTYLGGLTSSIYNEVLQFFLIVMGIVPVVVIGLYDMHGWSGLKQTLLHMEATRQIHPPGFTHVWANTGSSNNPMAITWPGIVLGLGFVLSFGYWCTDFLVVQRALAAKDLSSAQRTPLIAAFPKLLFPFIVIMPGLIALAVIPGLTGDANALPTHSYNNALPLLMAKYYPTGLLGLGLTALLASFMSGMAGNISAFNTVFTYDLYSVFVNKNASDQHYLNVGRLATIAGVLAGVAFADVVQHQRSIMDFTQTVFGFVNAPLLAPFLLGMFWRRTSAWGGFYGLLSGILAAAIHNYFTNHVPAGSFGQLFAFSSAMAGNFWRALTAFATAVIVTVLVSLVTKAPGQEQLSGLVYGHEAAENISRQELPILHRPLVLGAIILILMIILNVIFW